MPVRLEIVVANQKRLGAQSATMYDIRVQDHARQWAIERRFSDFMKLDNDLEEDGTLTRRPLPAKGLLGLRHRLGLRKFNDDRMAGLVSYLCHLCEQIETLTDSPALSSFAVDSQGSLPPKAPSLSSRASLLSKVSCMKESSKGSCITDLSLCETIDTASDARPSRHVYSVPTPLNKRLREFISGGDRFCFYSSEWEVFRFAQPTLADVIEHCAVQVGNTGRFENGCEVLFRQVRTCVRSFSRSKAEPLTGMARSFSESSLSSQSLPSVSVRCTWENDIPGLVFLWEFLILVAVRRPFFKNQAAEVCQLLESTRPGAELMMKEGGLRNLKESVFALKVDCPRRAALRKQ